MKFATYRRDGQTRAGVVMDDAVHDLPGDWTVLDLVRAGLPEAFHVGERALQGPPTPLAEVSLRAPLQPPTIRDFVAFEEHVEGVVRNVSEEATVPPEWYLAPAFYFTNPYAVVGPEEPIAIPDGCRQLDFELEVAVVVGRDGANLTPDQAREHVFGYTILNDWSARDLQRVEMRVNLGPAKGKDFASSLGPWLVTADELEPMRDPDGLLALAMTAEVNDREVGRDLLSNMAWTFEELIAYASRGTTVRAGDVLGSGTCGNGGCLAELWGRRGGTEDPPALRAGDVVRLRVEGIGQLTNTVAPGTPAPAIPPARRRPRTRPTTTGDMGTTAPR